jgi:hypothetical protein
LQIKLQGAFSFRYTKWYIKNLVGVFWLSVSCLQGLLEHEVKKLVR